MDLAFGSAPTAPAAIALVFFVNLSTRIASGLTLTPGATRAGIAADFSTRICARSCWICRN